MAVNVGIDLGQNGSHKAAIANGAERRGKAFTVPVTREGFEDLFQRASAGTDEPLRVVMEPTGVAWLPLAALAAHAGHQVFVIKPQKANDMRKFMRTHCKSDPVDALALARIPEVDPEGVHAVTLPTPDVMELRRLVKRRERQAREVASQKKRLMTAIELANPQLLAALGDDKFTGVARALYRNYLDPVAVLKRGQEGLRKFWAKHSCGQGAAEQADAVYQACQAAKDLYQPLRDAGRLPFDYKARQREMVEELDWLEQMEAQVQALEAQIKPLYDALDPEHTLEQLPGVGPVISPLLLAMAGNSVERFANGARFVAYCGLAPRKVQSGNSDRRMPITKAGQRLLKKYLYLAADSARRKDPQFAEYYARRYENGVHHNRIIVALARKMAWRVYALLKRRDEARAQAPAGAAHNPVTFQLRDPKGKAITEQDARELVKTNYTRKVIDAKRAAANPPKAKKKGRVRVSMDKVAVGDATNEISATPPPQT